MKKIMTVAIFSIAAFHANGNDLPTVNLGLTSFLDGGLPAGPGWYGSIYLQNYSANKMMDQNGDKIPLPKSEVDYQVMLAQLSYLSEVKIGKAALGMNFILPWLADIDVDDGLNNQAIKAQNGLGDLLVGPFIQFDPIMGENGPKFIHRIEFQVNIPTGDYDRKKDINPSNNAFSLDPYWAATYWFNPKWTASTRIHYLYNFKNDKPTYSFGEVSDIKAGQAIHANFATEYAFTPQLRLGINGYWLKQITDTQVDGHDVNGRREQVWAIGPGMMYSFSKEDHIFTNAYFEQDAENRPQGSRIQFRYVHHFH
ncbi:SphA family protein [Acinetobacter gerneri]|uniref:SphA family protein n=1 Tax=Acinetobacter gerneri TaxID=202952 RepID=UPI00321309C3